MRDGSAWSSIGRLSSAWAGRWPGTRLHVKRLEDTVKNYLRAGDRETAARFALELQRARKELQENDAQLRLHEQAYENNLLKIKHAGGKLAEIRNKIAKYDADLKMSAAEAEMAKLAQDFHVNVTTDFGQIETVIQDRIDQNRAPCARGRGSLGGRRRRNPPGRSRARPACRGCAAGVREPDECTGSSARGPRSQRDN